MNNSQQPTLRSDLQLSDVKVIIFDCDGVMFDTTIANTAFYNSILDHCGRPEMTKAQIAYTMMHTVFESIAYLMEDDEQLIAKAHAFRKEMGYFPFLKKMEIEPDLKPLLQQLRPAFHTAVATNRTDTMPAVLSEFDLADDFDLVLTSLDVARPKPNPEILLKVLDHFGCLPLQALYIGDSEVDEKAARAARVHFAAYRNARLKADIHIQRLREIEAALPVQIAQSSGAKGG